MSVYRVLTCSSDKQTCPNCRGLVNITAEQVGPSDLLDMVDWKAAREG